MRIRFFPIMYVNVFFLCYQFGSERKRALPPNNPEFDREVSKT